MSRYSKAFKPVRWETPWLKTFMSVKGTRDWNLLFISLSLLFIIIPPPFAMAISSSSWTVQERIDLKIPWSAWCMRSGGRHTVGSKNTWFSQKAWKNHHVMLMNIMWYHMIYYGTSLLMSCYIMSYHVISYDTSTSISLLMLQLTYMSLALPIQPRRPDSSSASAAARFSCNSSRVLSLPSLQLNSSDLRMWHMLQGSAEVVLFIKPAMSHCSGQSPAWKQRGNTTWRILPSEQSSSIGL